MGRVYDEIGEPLQRFIRMQPMFFVATAPDRGRINLSPKGMDSLRVIDPKTIAYIDLVGSGAETIAHLRDNGRITIMWCSFGSKPRILRAYGRGAHLLPQHPEFDGLVSLFPEFRAVRSIIRVHVENMADSCGFGVPEMELSGQRTQLIEWAAGKSHEHLEAYKAEKNAVSIDGLPALKGNLR